MHPVLLWLRLPGRPEALPIPSFVVCALAAQAVAILGLATTLAGLGWTAPDVAALVVAMLALGWMGSLLLFRLGAWIDGDSRPCRAAGGLSALGGILGTFAAAMLSDLLPGGDAVVALNAFAPYASVGLAVGRVGCLLAGCDYGAPVLSGSPWPALRYPSWRASVPGLRLRGAPAFLAHERAGLLRPGATRSLPVHPVPIYWTVALLGLAGLLLALPQDARLLDRPLPPALVWALVYAALTWILEPLRGDLDRGLLAGRSLAQWGTALLAAGGLSAWLLG